MGQVVNLKQTLAQKFQVDETELISTLKNTAFRQKDGQVTDEQMTALMIVANEYDLNPFTKEIYAYPDKGGIVPVVSVDGWARIMNSHPQMDGIEFEYSKETVNHKGKVCHEWIECVIYRKDRTKPTRVREFFSEVVRSANFPTPWDTHPNRLHRHKAEIQGIRIAFGFAGIYDQDEAERILESREEKDVTPQDREENRVIEIEYYPAEAFEQNFPKWEAAILAGKRSPEQIIGMVESKGVLTDAQINTIKGVSSEAA